MKKRRIVLASILKPVDETRMFEKLGITLADTGKFDVFILGAHSAQKTVYAGIQFLSFPPFQRLSLHRVAAPWKVLRKLIQIKPDLIIICTHELLLITLVYRMLFKSKVIYDIQENYFRNILHTQAFPVVVRNLVAGWVRLKEKFAAPFIDWFFLAERGYEKEFSFFKNRYTVIQNKFRKPPEFIRRPVTEKIQLLFSGTLSGSTGVFEAIRLAKQLHDEDTNIELFIVGYCAQPAVLAAIRKDISMHSFILLIGGDQSVPHGEIMAAISRAHFGIVCYPSSPHTENSIPTKLYEYMGCELPILLQNYKPWIELTSPYPAAVVIDNFEHVYASHVLETMKQTAFYTNAPADVYWDSEVPKLLNAIQNLFMSREYK